MSIKKSHTILFVDDEPRITSALKALFRRHYKVLVANSAMNALDVLGENEVDVVVSDQRMPKMLGSEFLAIVSKRHPQTMRILLTGYMDKEAIVDSINEGEIYRYINKPWDNEEMRNLLSEATAASELPAYSAALAKGSVSKGESVQAGEESLEQPQERALLMIEKQQEVRHQIRKFCNDNSIMIYGMQNVSQAVAAATQRESIGVAVVELTDDVNSAIQTINLLKRAKPELITIALTDEFDAQTAVNLINQGQIFKYLAKPLDIEGFHRAIQTAFNRHIFLKKNNAAKKRFSVDKPSQQIISSLQGLFGRILGTSH